MTKQKLSKHFKALHDFEEAMAKHTDNIIYDDSISAKVYRNARDAETALNVCISTLNDLGFNG